VTDEYGRSDGGGVWCDQCRGGLVRDGERSPEGVTECCAHDCCCFFQMLSEEGRCCRCAPDNQ